MARHSILMYAFSVLFQFFHLFICIYYLVPLFFVATFVLGTLYSEIFLNYVALLLLV
uniref:Uncharacterized protein n=1 Tax=Arundo donax TaxID=35708 RepID=A0A0A8YSI4_ARUDO